MSDPIAQGPNADPEGQSQQSGSQEQSNGVQKRIDELVAQREQERRERSEERQMFQAQVTALTAAVEANRHQQQTVTQQQPAVEVDPAIAAQVQALMGPTLKQYEQTIRHQQQQLAEMQYQQQLNVVPPNVKTRADALLAEARRRGLQGWDYMDVLKMAAGEEVLAGRWTPQQAQAALNGAGQPRDERGRFGANAGAMTTQSAPPQHAPQNDALPQNFDSLHPAEQERILFARIQNKPL
jgi:hypothetical protein